MQLPVCFLTFGWGPGAGTRVTSKVLSVQPLTRTPEAKGSAAVPARTPCPTSGAEGALCRALEGAPCRDVPAEVARAQSFPEKHPSAPPAALPAGRLRPGCAGVPGESTSEGGHAARETPLAPWGLQPRTACSLGAQPTSPLTRTSGRLPRLSSPLSEGPRDTRGRRQVPPGQPPREPGGTFPACGEVRSPASLGGQDPPPGA